MKNMNKLILLIFTVVISVSIGMTVNAQENVDELINGFLAEYGKLRESSFDTKVEVTKQRENEFIDNIVYADEELRKEKINNLEKKLDINIVSAKTVITLDDYSISDNIIEVEAYEWTFFDYTGESDVIDTSGYGVNHVLTFEIKNNELKLIEDYYNEGPLTEMKSSNYNDEVSDEPTEKEIKEYNKIIEAYEKNNVNQNKGKDDLRHIPGHYIYYDRDGVATYADKYVYHSANGTIYSSYYNDDYKNFNSQGGDCANYVSQCIYEGGGYPMACLSNHSHTYPAWWYDNKGTSSTSDDEVTKSWAWTGAHYNRTFMKGIYGTVKDNPTDSDISKGDPIYVDWHNSKTTWYQHTYICVGHDNDGKPIINSHNKDYYHIRWKYGYSDSKYSVVQMDDKTFIPD